ncbi:MAG: transglycosylase SLT domain-containing protein [Myxococcota bacterium]
MSRVQVIAITLVAASLLSGRGPESVSHVSTYAAPAGVDVSADILRRLDQLNPHLTDAQLERIRAAILRYSAKYELDPVLVTAVIEVESAARPWARSPKGALGLMQVMPYMLRPLGLAGNASTIETNVEAGCLILADNIRRLGESDGISAYFWGSDIRGVAYLNRVQAARDRLEREIQS